MNRQTGIGRRGFIGAGAATLFAGSAFGGSGGRVSSRAETAAGDSRPPVGGKEVKFCAFADIHYYPGVFPHDTREWLERILDRADKAKADLIIHMGDFTHTPAALKDYVDFYNDFRIKTYHTIGNHDDDGNSHEETLAAYRLECGHYFFDKGGFRFVVTDTNHCCMDGKFVHYSKGNYYAVHKKIGGGSISRVSPEQLEWLKATIEGSPYPCIVTSHASYEREDGSPDRAAVRKIFNDANAKHPGRVRLVINGHHHCDHVRILDNIVYLDLNSANYDWMVKTHTAYPEEDVKRWKHARHVIAWNDPISAIITINKDGHLKIEGQRSEFYRGVTPAMAGLPPTNGRQCRLVTPNVQSLDLTMAYHGA